MPLPNSCAARIFSTSSRGIGPSSESVAKERSTSASQAHSSSICEGASTKSHEVAELVEQRDHVVVLHQRLREVADQHPLGELATGDPGGEAELGRVAVLAGPRVQVEVDPSEPV